jgi:hypothetical protein
MSWWWTRADRSGTRYLWQIDADPLLGLALLVLFFAAIVLPAGSAPTPAKLACGAIVLGGFGCFLAAKLSLLRRGIHASWGSGPMTPGYARLYRAGYALMVLGILLLAVLGWMS